MNKYIYTILIVGLSFSTIVPTAEAGRKKRKTQVIPLTIRIETNVDIMTRFSSLAKSIEQYFATKRRFENENRAFDERSVLFLKNIMRCRNDILNGKHMDFQLVSTKSDKKAIRKRIENLRLWKMQDGNILPSIKALGSIVGADLKNVLKN